MFLLSTGIKRKISYIIIVCCLQLLCATVIAGCSHVINTFDGQGRFGDVDRATGINEASQAAVKPAMGYWHQKPFDLNFICPGIYLSRVNQLKIEGIDVLPEIIIPLNNDIRRLRAQAVIRAIAPLSPGREDLPPSDDATSFKPSASYCFSSTEFHRYLFRLKPF